MTPAQLRRRLDRLDGGHAAGTVEPQRNRKMLLAELRTLELELEQQRVEMARLEKIQRGEQLTTAEILEKLEEQTDGRPVRIFYLRRELGIPQPPPTPEQEAVGAELEAALRELVG